ncbi:hypothetical protein BGX31_011526 [Mortierella sp. GBA43]|nr:hypothetical protein BGX31_011526 [Mortierella sp. GBA43]
MKAAAYSFAVAAVALTVSGLSVPALYKRAALQARGLACATKVVSSGVLTPECEELAGVTIEDNGIPIATFNTPSSPGHMEGNTFVSIVQNTPLKVIPGKQDKFVGFLQSIFTQKEHTYVIHGGLDAVVQLDLPLGIGQTSLNTPRIAFKSPVTLKGFDNFPKVDFVKQIDSTFNPATGVCTLTAVFNIHNPSQFDMKLGDISLQVLDQSGVVVGIAAMKDTRLQMGDNHITGVVTSTGPSGKELYKTLTTTGGTFTFQGYEGTSSNPIVAQGLRKFKAPVAIPKLSPA